MLVYLVAILAFGLLIAFHEFGHYWAARRMGMRVERFSIGFGPTLFTWRRGETEYCLSAFPLGGYVKVAGMATEDEVAEDDAGSYANKPAWRRLLVIAAGPFANYLLAFVLGVGLLTFANVDFDFGSTRVGEVTDGFPAAQAGMQAGDEVAQVGGVPVSAWQPMREQIDRAARQAAGQPIDVTVRRGGQTLALKLLPKDAKDGTFRIGVVPALKELPTVGLGRATIEATENLWLQSKADVLGLAGLFARRSTEGLSGPLGIISHTAEQAKRGLLDLVKTVWGLSIGIGVLNLLPVPGLDGGRLLFLVYEVLARRRVNQKVEGYIHAVGLVALLTLIVFVSYGDIKAMLFHRS